MFSVLSSEVALGQEASSAQPPTRGRTTERDDGSDPAFEGSPIPPSSFIAKKGKGKKKLNGGQSGKQDSWTKVQSKAVPRQNLVEQYIKKQLPEALRDDIPWAFKSEIPTAAEMLPSAYERSLIEREAQRSSVTGTVYGTVYDDDGEQEDDYAAEELELPANVIDGPYESKDEYLETQYALLREETVAPLRDAILSFARNPQMSDEGDTMIYTRVRALGFIFNSQALATRFSFSMLRAGKRIKWDQSKRLTQGTLVALTPVSDCFRTKAILATVAAKDLRLLDENPPKIDLFLASDDEIETDPFNEYIMVESRTGYFEASRHILSALQHMRAEKSPLMEHLVDLDEKVQAPENLQREPFMNLSLLYQDSELSSPVTAPKDPVIDCLANWPLETSPLLDASQMNALQRILTKRLAIIQGPPGTGKTHVSVMALGVLLDSVMYQAQNRPIIITAQTNHAVDQLLRHVARFEEKFVRLGGRSKDVDVIKQRTLGFLRWKMDARSKELRQITNQLNKITDEMSKMIKVFTEQALLDTTELVRMGLLTRDQVDSLEKGAEGMISCAEFPDAPRGPLAIWLDDELVRAGSDRAISENAALVYETGKEDQAVEELEEFEAEVPMRRTLDEDEDVEELAGKQCMLEITWTARKSPGVTAKEVKAALRQNDLWQVKERSRGAVYRHLYTQAMLQIRDKFRQAAKRYRAATVEKKYVRWWYDDVPLLREQRVIAMTTTGLSKYRGLIHALQPRIILVEEAAETLESYITAACMESVEQLVLVGDHQQLRPHCSVMDLEGPPYQFTVSMFERLVRNGVEYSSLVHQRRMAPSIRELLSPIYSFLEDHASVCQTVDEDETVVEDPRAAPAGMGGCNAWFLNHESPDEIDQHKSRFNEGEAQLVVAFANYLFQNGCPAGDITILTMYNGQKRRLHREINQHPGLRDFGAVIKVVTVDSYQGEENEVVLLSTVRNISANLHGNLGFLQVKNRICVAISRARRGFYIFGSVDLLGTKGLYNTLWPKILYIMQKQRRIASHMELACENHGQRTLVNSPDHFAALSGGCRWKCKGRLPCGHRCALLCHTIPHDQILCERPCERRFACGHTCENICSDICGCACRGMPETIGTDTGEEAAGGGAADGRDEPLLSGVEVDLHFFGDVAPMVRNWVFDITDVDEAEEQQWLASPLQPATALTLANLRQLPSGRPPTAARRMSSAAGKSAPLAQMTPALSHAPPPPPASLPLSRRNLERLTASANVSEVGDESLYTMSTIEHVMNGSAGLSGHDRRRLEPVVVAVREPRRLFQNLNGMESRSAGDGSMKSRAKGRSGTGTGVPESVVEGPEEEDLIQF